jgi:hypothetical protein
VPVHAVVPERGRLSKTHTGIFPGTFFPSFKFQPPFKNSLPLSSKKPVCPSSSICLNTILCSNPCFACLHLFTFLLQTRFPYIDRALEEIARARLAQVSVVPFSASLVTVLPSPRLFVLILQNFHCLSRGLLPPEIQVQIGEEALEDLSRRWKQLGLVRPLVHACA